MRLRFATTCAYKRATLCLALLGLITLAGCGDKTTPRYPVNGSVRVDGQAANGVMVIFCPVDAAPDVMKERPFGFTEPDGSFKLTTLKPADGAFAGHYKIIFQWPEKAAKPLSDGGRSMGGADRLQGRYMNLAKSQITADIKAGTNDLPPFELKTH